MKQFTFLTTLLFLPFLLTSCDKEGDTSVNAMTFEEFIPVYNSYIEKWLEGEVTTLKEKIADATEEEKIPLTRDLEKLEFRQSVGGYFQVKIEAELPLGLEWKDGMEHPEIGDPRAKKGGVLRVDYSSFPSTLRRFGPEANSYWRDRLYDKIHLDLISLHPENGAVIPAVADRWAVTDDGKTCIFHIDQEATYNDGVKVSAQDVLFSVFTNISDYVHAPYYKQYFREQFTSFKAYGDEFVSITLPSPKPLLPYYCNFYPSPRHFFKDYGPDFAERYQWKFMPTTGAYEVKPSGIVKGVSITQSRVQDWWAKDKKFYRYRFNPDAVLTTVIRDTNKAFELLRAGKLDYMVTNRPEIWYDKTEIPEVFNGYIEKSEFYNIYPRRPFGVYLNTYKPKLSDLNFRIGIHHSFNWQKIINTVYRGDYARLNQYSDGWGRYTNSDVKAYEYSVEKARAAFNKAGYTTEDSEGYLVNEQGERASLEISFGNIPIYHKFMGTLKTEAKSAGLELILDSLESGVWRKKGDEKTYDSIVIIFGLEPPFPQYYQLVHSSNAYDAEGNPKRSTNNMFSIADDRLDELSLKVRFAKSEDEIEEYSKEIQQIMHDLALFVPAFTADFIRTSSWRWVRWPNSETTKFAPAQTNEPYEVSVMWIDEEMKKETLEAKRMKKSFPEVVNIYDQYRQKGGAK